MGWIRWAWRQVTSMRTALVLLLLLAIAAVPGSIVPQRSADPNGVTQYFTDNPDLAPVLDNLQLFDVYTSAWFSAIYILLFVSLIGCVIPRTQHHWKALRARPPRTPARLARLDAYREELIEVADRVPTDRRAGLGRGIRRRRPRGEAAARRRLPRRALRLPRLVLGLGRARLPARDRQPRLPRRPGRRARGRGARRRLRLHRPARDRRGHHLRQHPAGLLVDEPGPLRLARARCRRTR